MPYYENVFIARQEISTQQVDAIADVFSEIIKDGGGEITKRENWGLKTLAYRIKKSRKAHYILFNIDAPANVVHEMERQMGINEDVLRHLPIRLDELSDEPSVQAQVKTNRSDEDRDSGEFKARSLEERAPEKPAEPPKPKYDFTKGLVAYYPFNGNAKDESGNGNESGNESESRRRSRIRNRNRNRNRKNGNGKWGL